MTLKILKYLCQFYIPIVARTLGITVWDQYNFDRVSVVANKQQRRVFSVHDVEISSQRDYTGSINRCTFTLPRRHFQTPARLHDTRQTYLARLRCDNSPSRTQSTAVSRSRVNSATYFAFAFSAPNTRRPVLNRGHATMQIIAARVCRAREGANRVPSPRSFLSSAALVHNI